MSNWLDGGMGVWALANVAIRTIAIMVMKVLVAVPREQAVAGGGASLFGGLSVVLIAVSPITLKVHKTSTLHSMGALLELASNVLRFKRIRPERTRSLYVVTATLRLPHLEQL
jgi:hypothetical protein